MMTKYNEPIENFLNFLKKAEEDYNIAISEQEIKNNETQDILHRLELGDDGYHNIARLSKSLRKVRQERREAKDTIARTEPIVGWCNNNKKILDSIRSLLGNVRKVEKTIENRSYLNRTDIVRDTLGGDENE